MHSVIEYTAIQKAFDVFNSDLFGGVLPQCLVTFQRMNRARGYFWADQFRSRRDDDKTHEIALNPDHFEGRTDREILSTLAHEMAHLWQQAYGKPSRRAYHNAEWAAKMREIGLQPSDTGEPGGKETGERVMHYIVDGGAFARSVEALIAGGLALNWNATPGARGGGAAAKQTRAKFVCPTCEAAAWAKPGARLACADCSEDDGELVLMEAAA